MFLLTIALTNFFSNPYGMGRLFFAVFHIISFKRKFEEASFGSKKSTVGFYITVPTDSGNTWHWIPRGGSSKETLLCIQSLVGSHWAVNERLIFQNRKKALSDRECTISRDVRFLFLLKWLTLAEWLWISVGQDYALFDPFCPQDLGPGSPQVAVQSTLYTKLGRWMRVLQCSCSWLPEPRVPGFPSPP